jgi:hypothetical protein
MWLRLWLQRLSLDLFNAKFGAALGTGSSERNDAAPCGLGSATQVHRISMFTCGNQIRFVDVAC